MPIPDLDNHILEFASQPAFWALGAFTLGSWLVTLLAAGSSPPPATTRKGRPIPRDPAPHFTKWLAPYLTSRVAQIGALAAYAGVLALQLLEGYWIIATGFRWGTKLFLWWPTDDISDFDRPFVRAVVILCFSTVVTALLGLAVLTVQASCIYELLYLVPAAKQVKKAKGPKAE